MQEKKTISILEKDGVTYRYDPEQQLYQQTLALDKELVRIGYYDIMSIAKERLDDPALNLSESISGIWNLIMLRMQLVGDEEGKPTGPSYYERNFPEIQRIYNESTDNEQRQHLFTLFGVHAMAGREFPGSKEIVAKYRDLVQRRAAFYTEGLRKAHAAMVEHDGHTGLIVHLLVPDGLEYGAESIAAIRKLLLRLTMEEVESVISNFLNSGKLSNRLSPNYLIQVQPLGSDLKTNGSGPISSAHRGKKSRG